MDTPALFRFLPEAQKSIPWVSIISEPTRVYPLTRLSKEWGFKELYVKREDLTEPVLYGGNKVRNLEFILGEAITHNRGEVLSMAPYGSNFVSALTAQCFRLNLPVRLEQFVLADSEQARVHADFSLRWGAQARVASGATGILRAAVRSSALRFQQKFSNRPVQWCPPGATNVKGVLGHVNAGLELAEQVEQGLIPRPDFVVVGVGTCGTIAGLLAAFTLLNWPTKIVGVRCISGAVARRDRVLSLARAALTLLGSQAMINPDRFVLVQDRLGLKYATWNDSARNLHDSFLDLEDITLDATYTVKVTHWISEMLQAQEFSSRRVLYWHTFSDRAVRWQQASQQSASVSV